LNNIRNIALSTVSTDIIKDIVANGYGTVSTVDTNVLIAATILPNGKVQHINSTHQNSRN
jgi:hypothetical protein